MYFTIYNPLMCFKCKSTGIQSVYYVCFFKELINRNIPSPQFHSLNPLNQHVAEFINCALLTQSYSALNLLSL